MHYGEKIEIFLDSFSFLCGIIQMLFFPLLRNYLIRNMMSMCLDISSHLHASMPNFHHMTQRASVLFMKGQAFQMTLLSVKPSCYIGTHKSAQLEWCGRDLLRLWINCSVSPHCLCVNDPPRNLLNCCRSWSEKKSTQLMSLFPAPERDYVGFGGSNGPLADKL